MSKIILLASLLALSLAAVAQDSFSYVPAVHGTVKSRYEIDTDRGESRFQVRNARVNVTGRVAPVIDYKFELDLCDRGSVRTTDVWAGMWFTRSLKMQIGQMRMPFGVDASRNIGRYWFVNHSFLGSYVGNKRGVGAKLAYAFATLPLTAEAGVFNTYTINRHAVWQRKMSYSGKARYTVSPSLFVEGGIESTVPDSVRINHLDATVGWTSGRWAAEAEYVYKHYTNHAFKATHSWNLMAAYEMPVNVGCFSTLAIQGRWDGATDHSDGIRDDDGRLTLTEARRQRLTLGSTLGYHHDKLSALLRLNYEHYFHPSGTSPHPVGEGNVISAEMIVNF